MVASTLRNFTNLVKAMAGKSNIAEFRDRAEAEIEHLSHVIPPDSQSVTRLETSPPGKGVNVMMRTMPFRKKIKLVPTLLRTMNIMTQCGTVMKDKLTPTQQAHDPILWEKIQQIAKQQGVKEIGIVPIKHDNIFKDFVIPYANAIVFTVDMDKEVINTAPSHDALIEVLYTYGSLGEVGLNITDVLREAGYGAYPGFPIGGMVDYVRVAQDAGIGAIGYHGLLISPSDGTRQRINVVYTNMECPTPDTNPHSWILDFCAMCNQCVRQCPSDAIYTDGEVNAITGRKPTLHYDQCLDYYANNNGCAVCVKVCPFSQAGYDKVMAGFMKSQAEALQ